MHTTLIAGLLCLFLQSPEQHAPERNASEQRAPESGATFESRFGEQSQGPSAEHSQAEHSQAGHSHADKPQPDLTQDRNRPPAGQNRGPAVEPRRFNPSAITARQIPDVNQQSYTPGSTQNDNVDRNVDRNPVRSIADAINNDRSLGPDLNRQYDVQPVAYQQNVPGRALQQNQPASGDGYQASSSVAKTIMEQALIPASNNLLPGNPLTLKEAIGKKFDRDSRRSVAKEYWKAAVNLADFQFATEEVDYISQIAAPQSGEARALWQADVAAADARVAETKLSAMDAQELLRQQLGLPYEQPPVVVDTPWVGRYQTNFDQHASAGLATQNLRRIDRILPVMWQLVQRRAAAVESSRIAFNELSRVYQRGGCPVGEILGMHRRWRDQRIAFLGAVRDYNFSIADYAMSTVNANGDVNKVTAMLLFDDTVGLEKVSDGAVRQASATGDPVYQRKGGAEANRAPAIQVQPIQSTQPQPDQRDFGASPQQPPAQQQPIPAQDGFQPQRFQSQESQPQQSRPQRFQPTAQGGGSFGG